MGEETLFDGISREAAEEADKILKQAETQAGIRKKGAERQVEEIRKQSEKELAERLAEIRKRSESAIQFSTRRSSLKYREELYAQVTALAEKKMAEKTGKPGYDEFLAGLIAEGVIGLDKEKAVVSVSGSEKLTPDILAMAADLVKKTVGREVSLKEGAPVSSQGVVVASEDGRVSFSNQITARFRRYDQEIRKIIYDELEKKE